MNEPSKKWIQRELWRLHKRVCKPNRPCFLPSCGSCSKRFGEAHLVRLKDMEVKEGRRRQETPKFPTKGPRRDEMVCLAPPATSLGPWGQPNWCPSPHPGIPRSLSLSPWPLHEYIVEVRSTMPDPPNDQQVLLDRRAASRIVRELLWDGYDAWVSFDRTSDGKAVQMKVSYWVVSGAPLRPDDLGPAEGRTVVMRPLVRVPNKRPSIDSGFSSRISQEERKLLEGPKRRFRWKAKAGIFRNQSSSHRER